jgi:hypothetical protein
MNSNSLDEISSEDIYNYSGGYNKKIEDDLYKISYKLFQVNYVIGNNIGNNFTGGNYEIKLIKNILKKKFEKKLKYFILHGGNADPYLSLKNQINDFITKINTTMNKAVADNIKKITAKITTQIDSIVNNEITPAVNATISDIMKISQNLIKELKVDDLVNAIKSGLGSQLIGDPLKNLGNSITFGLFKEKENSTNNSKDNLKVDTNKKSLLGTKKK